MQGGARGGEARLELDQMPRKALRSKACGERSEDFRAAQPLAALPPYGCGVLLAGAAQQNENLALFQAVKKSERTFLTA